MRHGRGLRVRWRPGGDGGGPGDCEVDGGLGGEATGHVVCERLHPRLPGLQLQPQPLLLRRVLLRHARRRCQGRVRRRGAREVVLLLGRGAALRRRLQRQALGWHLPIVLQWRQSWGAGVAQRHGPCRRAHLYHAGLCGPGVCSGEEDEQNERLGVEGAPWRARATCGRPSPSGRWRSVAAPAPPEWSAKPPQRTGGSVAAGYRAGVCHPLLCRQKVGAGGPPAAIRVLQRQGVGRALHPGVL